MSSSNGPADQSPQKLSQAACGGHGHSHSGQSHGHQSGHSHAHGHGHSHAASGNIGFAFFLNLIFSLVELVGGLWAGSMAIVAGAIHDFGDALSLGTAWVLERFANKDRDQNFNFGYRRFSLLSALIAGVVISTGSIFIIVEAIHRFGTDEEPAGPAILILSFVGLVVNAIAALRLASGVTQNERVLTWHSIEDIASWGAVFIGGIFIYFFHIKWLDPLLAIALGIFVLFNVLRHLKETVYLFLQGRPGDFDEDEFLKATLKVSGVEHVDHLAVWSLDGHNNVLSARLHLHNVRDPLEIEKVKEQVRTIAALQRARATLETCMVADVDHSEPGRGDGR